MDVMMNVVVWKWWWMLLYGCDDECCMDVMMNEPISRIFLGLVTWRHWNSVFCLKTGGWRVSLHSVRFPTSCGPPIFHPVWSPTAFDYPPCVITDSVRLSTPCDPRQRSIFHPVWSPTAFYFPPRLTTDSVRFSTPYDHRQRSIFHPVWSPTAFDYPPLVITDSRGSVRQVPVIVMIIIVIIVVIIINGGVN